MVYGRRRVGKTELIEQTFADRNLLKFEGLERQPRESQLREFARLLASYANIPFAESLRFSSWTEALTALAHYVRTGTWTVYLEELQWMANYETELVSALKSVWDNEFRRNPNIILVLCGSAPSFMVNKVLHSAALYNRTEVDFPVSPFSLRESKLFMGQDRSEWEVMDAVLTVGAIPPYLEKLKDQSSIFLSLAKHSFVPPAYFANEYERIFTSSLSSNSHYRKILEYLSEKPFANRGEIAKVIGKEPGGEFSALLKDLEQMLFIHRYYPPQATFKSRGFRYELSDPFIRFYNRFIFGRRIEINQGLYSENPERALSTAELRPYLGLNFERWLRQRPALLPKLLGFSGIEYRCGSYFSRKTPGAQIDMVYDRADKVVTMVEVKYTTDPVGSSIISEFEAKLKLYPLGKKSLQRILVSAAGGDKSLNSRMYFDKIITLPELFEVEPRMLSKSN